MQAGDGWRYIAQRFDGTSGGLGDFLDLNVPLQGVNIEEVLSGDNALTGTITPEFPRLKGPDGRPILEEGGSAIWAESPDGEIRGGGIVTHSGFNDNGEWSIECTDLTGTSNELPYTGADFFVNVDPMDLFRFIWQHIQSHRNHNLGISVDGTKSPVLIGNELVQFIDFDTEEDVSEDLEPAPVETAPPRYATNVLWREAAVKALKANNWKPDVVDAALKKWLQKDALTEAGTWKPLTDKERQIRDKSIERVGWPPNPPSPGRKQTLVVNIRPQMNPPDDGEIIETPEETPEEAAKFQYDAFKLNWYETLDLGSTLADLASMTPFDWHLTHRWDGDEIRHNIRLGYPRLGRRREDLRFVVGENIGVAPSVERDASEYANEVVVFGAGEGSSIIVGRAFRRDDTRIRRVATISDPSIKTIVAANARAEQELAKRYNVEEVTEVTLKNHPHAPLGSIDLGDEILVEGDLGWIDLEMWCRVIGRTMSPDDGESQTLTLLRSDKIA